MNANQGRTRKLWTPEEDQLLISHVQRHGPRQWDAAALESGLVGRSANSCWLRWFNHLKPEIRSEDFTTEEVHKILGFHQQWGNSWSKIAQQLPGRTANQIKNFWNTNLSKQAKMLNYDADIGDVVAAPLHFSEMSSNAPNQDHYPVADSSYMALPDIKGFDDFCSFDGML